MNARPLTDAQIARALRAHLPERAQAGLLERVYAEVAETTQKRTLPAFVAGLFDADPAARRRYQLIAATLLVALVLAAVAGVGAWLKLQKPGPNPLSLEPPTNLAAYVTGAYEGLLELPPLTITIVEVEGTKTRWSWNGAGVLRLDHYFSPNDAEPGLFRLYTDQQMAGEEDLNGETVWVTYGGQGNPLAELAMATGLNRSCPVAWSYVGLEYLIERPTHHIACGESAMWFDIETGLPLKSINVQDSSIGPTITFNVIELVVGPQPADLFVPRSDVRTLSDVAYGCAIDPGNCQPTGGGPTPTPRPLVTPPPAPGTYAVPTDLDALVDAVLATSARPTALETLQESYSSPSGGDRQSREYLDGSNRSRSEHFWDPTGVEEPTVYLTIGDKWYESYGLTEDGRTIWQEHEMPNPSSGVPTLGLSQPCNDGWEHRGFDLVVGRPAHHLACGYAEYWIDMDWLLVVRSQYNPDPLAYETYVQEILELHFGEQPAELFELPADAVICQGRASATCLDGPSPPPGSPSPSPSP